MPPTFKRLLGLARAIDAGQLDDDELRPTAYELADFVKAILEDEAVALMIDPD